MSNTQPYEILVGVGTLYVAPANTAKTALTATPSGSWRLLGDTDGGVKVTKTRNREAFSADQHTGKLKAVQTEEGITIETNLQESTLENLADVINGTVTDTAPGVGTIGTRSVKMYSGSDVTEFAFLFRGKSPYGNYPAQFYLPRGYFDDDVEHEFTKDGLTLIPVKFEALEDLNAATEADRFGIYEAQDAAAT
jgi:hypothetical protein